jgi:hypothetical protein
MIASNSGSMSNDSIEEAAKAAKAIAGDMKLFRSARRGDRSYLASQPSLQANKRRKSKRKQQQKSRRKNRT